MIQKSLGEMKRPTKAEKAIVQRYKESVLLNEINDV
jgi:hypothetical protein